MMTSYGQGYDDDGNWIGEVESADARVKAHSNRRNRIAIRARDGFGAVELFCWEAERSCPGTRLHYRRLAAVARHLHVKLHLAEWTSEVTLPDSDFGELPDDLWKVLEQAERKLKFLIPRPAAMLTVLAYLNLLEPARVVVTEHGRALIAVLAGRIEPRELDWLEEYDEGAVQTIDNDSLPQETPEQVIHVAAPPADHELDDFAAVLRTFYRGKIRRVVTTDAVIEATGLGRNQVLDILSRLESLGRIRQQDDSEWAANARN